MTQTPIAVKNGKARPKNPFEEYQTNAVGDSTWKRTQEWKDFESTVQWHDCPEATEDGEYEAELVWQVKGPFGIWEDISDLAHDNFRKSNENPVAKSYIMREIWRIVPQPQEGKIIPCSSPSVTKHSLSTVFGEKEEAKTVEGKTPQEILNSYDSINSQFGIRTHEIIEAMQAYSSQQNTDLQKRLDNAVNLATGIICIELLKIPSELLVKYKIDIDRVVVKLEEALKPKQ